MWGIETDWYTRRSVETLDLRHVSTLGMIRIMTGRTIKQRHSQTTGIVKAGELIEIYQSHALTLQDRRVMNILIESAGAEIAEPKEHRIPLSKLKPPQHRSSERIVDSLKKLVTTALVIATKTADGAPALEVVPFLGRALIPRDESGQAGEVVFEFPAVVRKVIANSNYWGRVKASVMFAFSSKYALALYEAISLRINRHQREEYLADSDLRELLGVEPNILPIARDLRKRVIDIALDEVNALSDYKVEIETVREGGARSPVKGYKLRWDSKSPEEWESTRAELDRPKVGRKARLTGNVEKIEMDIDIRAMIPDKRAEY